MALATRLAGVVVALSVAAMPTQTVPASAEPLTLRLHTHIAPEAASFKHLQWWALKVAQESGGRLKIDLFPSNQLGGNAEDIYDQVKNGTVDIGWTLPGYKPSLFPTTSAFELPFIGAEATIASPALDDYARKWGKAEWRAVHLIVFHSQGASALHMTTRPIERLADFKGMKLRTRSRIAAAALTALGSTPVLIPAKRGAEAVMGEIADGVVSSWSIAPMVDVSKFHTETHLHAPTFAMIMNKNTYSRLPHDLKQVIDGNSGRSLAKAFGAKWRGDDARSRSRARALNHPVTVVAEKEESLWRNATRSIHADWIKEMDAMGLPGKPMLEDAERLIAKYKSDAGK
jgi:TRAP-type C4-dicarboxylate transport system substrate-binding protein